jgi:hypothetical protein
LSWRGTTKRYSFQFGGGLFLGSSGKTSNMGLLADCRNYEIDPSGWYTPCKGYEPIDGTGKPSEALFQIVYFTGCSAELSGTVTDGGAKAGEILLAPVVESGSYAGSDAAGYTVVLMTAGAFSAGDILDASATVESVGDPGYAQNGTDEIAWRKLAIAKKMSLVGEVPGEGPLRGVVKYKGDWYAFRDNAGQTACVMYKTSVSGWSAVADVPELAPGGYYRLRVHNFYGHTDKLALYGVDGKNKAFQFDGTIFTQLTTGMTADTPTHLTINRNHLFLAFTGGSLQHSATGDPTSYTLLLGAAEIGLGDEIRGMEVVADTLLLWTENHIQALYGSSTLDWTLGNLSPMFSNIKTTANTVQVLGSNPLFYANGSMRALSTTQKYGNFQNSSVSINVDKFLEQLDVPVSTSCTIAEKNQYYLFFENGLGLVAKDTAEGLQYMLVEFPHAVRCCSPFDDEICFGSDDGFVYLMDSGANHAGEPIQYFSRTLFSDFGSPSRRKTLRKLALDLGDFSGHDLNLNVTVETGKYRKYAPQPGAVNLLSQAGDGYWNSSLWNSFYWSQDLTDKVPEVRLNGIALTFALTFYSNVEVTDRYVLAGADINYSERGLQR